MKKLARRLYYGMHNQRQHKPLEPDPHAPCDYVHNHHGAHTLGFTSRHKTLS